MNEEKNCCQNIEKKNKGFLSGLLYGLLPHTGCIAFIFFTILGVTTATAIFRPLLMNRYFFHILIGISFLFATISAIIYLKRCKLLSIEGIKIKKKYLSILYGTSIGVNILLFLVIFPILANVTSATPAGNSVTGLSEVKLKVDIPCSGHAPLISEELKTINGVKAVRFEFPDYFYVSYDSSEASQEKILSLGVFREYPATKVSGDNELKQQNIAAGCSKCSSCNGACGGTCRA